MRKKITLYTIALLGTIVLFNSCKKEYDSIESIDDAKIQAYIKQNNLTMTKDASGFYYQVLDPGTGAVVLNKDSVFFNLNVQSLSGTNYYTTASFSNEATYLGYITPTSYRIALNGIKRGGKVRVILPSYLAYGKNGSGNIPSNEIISSVVTVYPQVSQTMIDDKNIVDYLSSKGLTATKGSSGVYYIVLQKGTGLPADISSSLTVKYTGRLLSGSIFDQTSGDGTYTASLNDPKIILGWRKGLLGFNKGSKVRLFIPSGLAYGTSVQSGIPANSVLDFDIELVDVTN